MKINADLSRRAVVYSEELHRSYWPLLADRSREEARAGGVVFPAHAALWPLYPMSWDTIFVVALTVMRGHDLEQKRGRRAILPAIALSRALGRQIPPTSPR